VDPIFPKWICSNACASVAQLLQRFEPYSCLPDSVMLLLLTGIAGHASANAQSSRTARFRSSADHNVIVRAGVTKHECKPKYNSPGIFWRNRVGDFLLDAKVRCGMIVMLWSIVRIME
jgi:hypothetical protein